MNSDRQIKPITQKIYEYSARDEFNTKFINFKDKLSNNIHGNLDKGKKLQYSQVLCIRLISLYFIQKSQFFERNCEFLNHQLDQHEKLSKNYYSSFINPLFQKLGWESIFDFKILNFPSSNEVNDSIFIPNQIFREFYSFFDSYSWNFNDLVGNNIEKTLSPKDLEYIFINSFLITDSTKNQKKETGSYYTSQLVAEFLIEKSIDLYLVRRYNQETNSIFQNLGDIFTNEESELKLMQFYDILAKISILDNACGSGEFLLAALNLLGEIWLKLLFKLLPTSSINMILSPYLRLHNLKHDYFPKIYPSIIEFKKNSRWRYFVNSYILQQNLYGVDLQIEASEISKFRISIALISDFEISKQSDFSPEFSKMNIFSGNSLIGNISKEEPSTDLPLDCIPFHWDRKFPQIFSESTGKRGFDIIIGNPPYGNLLSNTEKEIMKLQGYSYLNEISSIFIERSLLLLKDEGILSFIVPKSIGFYSTWDNTRKKILNNTLEYILDLGLGFRNVNGEQLAFILSNHFPESEDLSTLKVKNYILEPQKKQTQQKIISFGGTIDLNLMKNENILIFSQIDPIEEVTLSKIKKNSILFSEIYKEKAFRSLYIPDAVKKNFKRGDTLWIDKVPHIQRYYLKQIQNINFENTINEMIGKNAQITTNLANSKRNTLREKSKKIKSPGLFFKVLRGKHLVCFLDIRGEFLTTEKLVNVNIKENSRYDLFMLMLIINSPIPSFYVQKLLFSETTETSRILDDVYMRKIPIPKKSSGQYILRTLCQYLLVLNSEKKYRDPYYQSIEFLERHIVNPLIYEKYLLETEDLMHLIEKGDQIRSLDGLFENWWDFNIKTLLNEIMEKEKTQFKNLKQDIMAKIIMSIKEIQNNIQFSEKSQKILQSKEVQSIEVFYYS